MTTRIKLKELQTFVDLSSNKLTLYITYSIHGRRDYVKAAALCNEELHRLFPPITSAIIASHGWKDPKCKAIYFTVKLLVADKAIYKHYDSWRG